MYKKTLMIVVIVAVVALTVLGLNFNVPNNNRYGGAIKIDSIMKDSLNPTVPELPSDPSVPSAFGDCNPVLQWEWDGPTQDPAFPNPCSIPVVAQLTDDNLDLQIDDRDDLDVVFVTSNDGRLDHRTSRAVIKVLDGITGNEHFTINSPISPLITLFGTEVALGDIDGDGLNEIISNGLIGNVEHLVAFENDGTLKWIGDALSTTAGTFYEYRYLYIGLADLNQDGSTEIYTSNAVFNNDGTLLWRVPGRGLFDPPSNMVNDIYTLNPGLEFFSYGTLYNSNGNPLWSIPIEGQVAVGEFVSNFGPEIVAHVGGGGSQTKVIMYGQNGNQIGTPYTINEVLTRWASPPLISDIDADNYPEVVIQYHTHLYALEWDGTTFIEKWVIPILDRSELNGPSAFKFGQDCASEIVVQDEQYLYIIDGETGTILSQLDSLSGTFFESPVIVNLDHDESAEIVTGGCAQNSDMSTYGKVKVFGCTGSTNTPRKIWNQHPYHITNVNDDGTIPMREPLSSLVHNSWSEQHGSQGFNISCGCIDTDNGIDPDNFGVVTYSTGTYPDNCKHEEYPGGPDPSSSVFEKYCENGIARGTWIGCPNLCDDGHCLP